MKSKFQQERIEKLFRADRNAYALQSARNGCNDWEDISIPCWKWDKYDYRIKGEDWKVLLGTPEVLVIERDYPGDNGPWYREYYKNDKLHRTDGPAKVEWPMAGCGANPFYEFFYVEGEKMSKETFYEKYLRNPKPPCEEKTPPKCETAGPIGFPGLALGILIERYPNGARKTKTIYCEGKLHCETGPAEYYWDETGYPLLARYWLNGEPCNNEKEWQAKLDGSYYNKPCPDHNDLKMKGVGPLIYQQKKPILAVGDSWWFFGEEYKVASSSLWGQDWYWLRNLSNSYTEVFNKLSIDPFKFQEEVVGYNAGSYFPECKSLADLDRFVLAIDKKIQEAVHVPKYCLSLGEEIWFEEYKFKVDDKQCDSTTYFLDLINHNNECLNNYEPFGRLGIELKDLRGLHYDLFGYMSYGDFPECDTLEDLTTFVFAIRKELAKK